MPETFLYGPPPDPREIHVGLEVIDHPGLYVACIGLGIGLSALAAVRRQPEALRAWWFCLGQTIMLTSPLALVFSRDLVYGAYPTIDKAGSLLFYLDGVHQRLTFSPIDALADPAAQLIGVHVGHLWITAFLDLFVSVNGAFNLQGLLYPALGWWCAALLLREVSDSWRVAVLLSFPFGMGLHVFRDLNWYTIEKASVFALALFAWAFLKAAREGGRWRAVAAGVFAGAAFINWYWALVGAAGVAAATLVTRSRGVLIAGAACAAALLPLVIWQFALMNSGTPGDPELYLHERAALDSFSFIPPHWNRLELHRSLNIVGLASAAYAVSTRWRDPLVLTLAGVAGLLLTLALGPNLAPAVPNPVYMAIWHVVPGFWRVAKPEVFFEGTYLGILMLAAIGFQGRKLTGMLLYPTFVVGWLLMVRSHPVYPEFSAYQDLELSEAWQRAGADEER